MTTTEDPTIEVATAEAPMPPDIEDVEAIPAAHADSSDLKSLITSKKKTDTFPLAEDIYAFIYIAPYQSATFVYSCYVFLTKIIAYGILLSDINWNSVDSYSKRSAAVKFFLIPVAVAMQEDLMQVFFCAANIVYSEEHLRVSPAATKTKLFISFALKLIDGALSLGVNFYVMLTTVGVLNVFLNFAALQFLQSIDDIFYEMVIRGFFGDKMEAMATLCTKIEFPRRAGDENTTILWGLRVSHLDSLLFGVTFFCCFMSYVVIQSLLAGYNFSAANVASF